MSKEKRFLIYYLYLMDKQIIIETSLKNAGFTSLNELQLETIKKSERNNNLMILSQTGSGKTFAFLLPVLFNLKKDFPFIQAVIIAPSRELAIQIETVFRSLKTGHKVLTCYGGHSMKSEKNSLSEAPAVLIGTPGRICDHIQRENLDLGKAEQLVIDEYDKCLEFGFEEQMKFIRQELRRVKRTSLVSATKMEEFPEYLDFSQASTINYLNSGDEPDITYFSVPTNSSAKYKALMDLLCSFEAELSIVFCNFREATEEIAKYLDSNGFEALVYHGGMEQEERERALIKFRNGSYHTLICTDLGSRGLDIPEIQHVVHFQYPHNKEAFIHRNGRTARMKSNGSAYLLINKDEQVPEYLEIPKEEFRISKSLPDPMESQWITLYFSGGKKDKINKIDLVGFLGQKGGLQKEEIGLIAVLDHSSYVAINRDKVRKVLEKIKNEKVKGKKLRIAISK
jgi:superfamily II DNA/RNA helicase